MHACYTLPISAAHGGVAREGHTMNNLTNAGRQLLTMVGDRDFSFFDEGIVEHSGIWHECMTGESAGTEGMPRTARGVANVISKLAADGYLDVHDQGDDDGVWVTLTALGADTANALATPVEVASSGPSHDPSACSVRGCALVLA